jgi:hypothetical protein
VGEPCTEDGEVEPIVVVEPGTLEGHDPRVDELPKAPFHQFPPRLDPAVVLGFQQRDDPPAPTEYPAPDIQYGAVE